MCGILFVLIAHISRIYIQPARLNILLQRNLLLVFILRLLLAQILVELIKVEDIDAASLARVKHQFYARGEGISGWAEANGFSAAMVYSVLNGRCKARRGQAHRIAVALGLKEPLAVSEGGTRPIPNR
ncbi:UNVERIFIED_ORG: DNA-binding protein [Shinella sp. XGS7]|nr:DNA-binding protein [Shinella sp. XGS7]